MSPAPRCAFWARWPERRRDGVVIGLSLTGLPFSFTAFLGLLSLSGVLIKNGIVMIEEIDLVCGTGKPLCEAIIEASVSRMRPVTLAAATTILGMLPMLTDQFFQPMAVTIMDGLAFASILTRIAVPVFCYVLVSHDAKREEREEPVPEPACSRAGIFRFAVCLPCRSVLRPSHMNPRTPTICVRAIFRTLWTDRQPTASASILNRFFRPDKCRYDASLCHLSSEQTSAPYLKKFRFAMRTAKTKQRQEPVRVPRQARAATGRTDSVRDENRCRGKGIHRPQDDQYLRRGGDHHQLNVSVFSQ